MFDLRTAIARDAFNIFLTVHGKDFATTSELRSFAINAVNAGKALEAEIAEYDPLIAEQLRKDEQLAETLRQQLAQPEPAPTEAPQPEESSDE